MERTISKDFSCDQQHFNRIESTDLPKCTINRSPHVPRGLGQGLPFLCHHLTPKAPRAKGIVADKGPLYASTFNQILDNPLASSKSVY